MVAPYTDTTKRVVKMLEQLRDDAVMSKFATSRECHGYRQAVTDMIAMLKAVPLSDGPKDGWIPVFKKLPEDGQSVLVYTAEGDFFQAYRNPDYHGGFERNGRFVVGVTHWHSVVPPPLATSCSSTQEGK